MSMNIYITATRKITFKKKNGKRSGDTQTVKFNAWQTPTVVSYGIIDSKEPRQAYVDWILRECSVDREFPVFADDDIFGDGEPVGVEIINEGKAHVEEFRAWINQVEEEGFTVNFEVI
jgi:hypothetical protein